MDPYRTDAPSRAEIERLPGAVVVDFGTNWCGYCRNAEPLIAAALANASDVTHLRIEDGPGRPTGRAFRVKLWPTLVFLRNGKEVTRVVRPDTPEQIGSALAALQATSHGTR